MDKPFRFILLCAVLVGVQPSTAQAVQKMLPSPPQALLGLGLVLGDPEGWGIIGKLWLTHDIALQPALKLGFAGSYATLRDGTTSYYAGNYAVQCDILWHNYSWIPTDDDSWPVYFGGGWVYDSWGPGYGVRGIIGLSYIFYDVPGDLFIQLVPTDWLEGLGPAFQVDLEVGCRLYL